MKNLLRIRRFLCCVLLLASAGLAWTQPAQVVIIRHAEKPDDPDALHLSPRGQERPPAKAMASAPAKPSNRPQNN
jgi:hypothetical protein